MKVRMKVGMSGTRSGELWPALGEVGELPDKEAVKLCSAGLAEPVTGKEKQEKAIVEDDSTEPRASRRRPKDDS